MPCLLGDNDLRATVGEEPYLTIGEIAETLGVSFGFEFELELFEFKFESFGSEFEFKFLSLEFEI